MLAPKKQGSQKLCGSGMGCWTNLSGGQSFKSCDELSLFLHESLWSSLCWNSGTEHRKSVSQCSWTILVRSSPVAIRWWECHINGKKNSGSQGTTGCWETTTTTATATTTTTSSSSTTTPCATNIWTAAGPVINNNASSKQIGSQEVMLQLLPTIFPDNVGLHKIMFLSFRDRFELSPFHFPQFTPLAHGALCSCWTEIRVSSHPKCWCCETNFRKAAGMVASLRAWS